jgi:hypothetical protein
MIIKNYLYISTLEQNKPGAIMVESQAMDDGTSAFPLMTTVKTSR